MSDTEQQDDAATESNAEAKEKEKSTSSKGSSQKRIYLVPYPKFVFMYPTLIVSVLASIVLGIGGYSTVSPDDSLPVAMTVLFLGVFVANLFVIVFDFPRATSLTLVFIVATAIMAGWLVLIWQPGLLPSIETILRKIHPVANSTFYFCMSVAMALMYAAVFVSARFNYWELTNNELLHHHGVLSDLKRYPAPNLRVDKEINDVFEYALLGAGRLILHPATEKRAIVLDNILWVGSKEAAMTRMLGSIKVKIGDDSGVR
ncbi:MAG: hypothetical protein AAFX06_27680 [Planctomycetota bacterium]